MKLSPLLRKKLELTLAILKPDLCKNPPALKEVKSRILNNGFLVCQSAQKKLSLSDVEKFYSEHKGKFFYNRLVYFMSSGLVSIHILAQENAISKWREMMGPTKVFRTKYEMPDTIRGTYGITDTRNATHGSDSVENAHKEIKFFFKNFDIEEFHRLTFAENYKVEFDPSTWEHKFSS